MRINIRHLLGFAVFLAFETCLSLILALGLFATVMAWLEGIYEEKWGLAAGQIEPEAGPPGWVLSHCAGHGWTDPHRDSDGFWRAFPTGAFIPLMVPQKEPMTARNRSELSYQ
ncbi:hypothetical protein [Leptolyngbya sp. FACHB-261]|uniref:hypothetical protein n=1 Tax=Leptolyngbya sp. FACHB-261 TaxID=2692806 RepID=UPI001685CF04|nr:hypothetical protein [Leptolyngbya sp. FACHB-261]MBD2101973.1 hypothetical protein [Leptolyngbya sp. FACHB-261]